MQLEAAVFDGYDVGIFMPYLEGANKVMLARSGISIRRGEHPLCRYWRVPKAQLLDELDLSTSYTSWPMGSSPSPGKASGRRSRPRSLPHAAMPSSGNVTSNCSAGRWLRLLSGDYHPGVVAVARRMHGVFLGRSSSWRVNATAKILRRNFILELGLAEEQFEILDMVQELLGDGSVVPTEDIPRISLGGAPQKSSVIASGEETSNDIYLAAVSSIERTKFTNAMIAQALAGNSLLDHQPAVIAHLHSYSR